MRQEHRRAVCHLDCPDTCAMVVTLDEGRAVALGGAPEHPVTRGFLCQKMAHYVDLVYHPNRLRTPLKRVGPKGSGQFRPISWEEALTEIAARFREIAAGPHGPQAILPYSYSGTLGKIQSQSLDRRFFHRLGASLLDRTICASAGGVGYTCTVGGRIGTQPEAFAESRYIINWGSNTAATNSHLWTWMVAARKAGAKIVTIDPYRCRTAERSDWHLMPRVGTDAALALGMMHILFRDSLQDDDYLRQYCLGGNQLRDRVMAEYGPERVSQITGISIADLEQLTHEYASQRPSAIRINYGLQRHYGGGMAVRTIACLPAVVGAWRDWAGGILLSTSGQFPLNYSALERPDLIPPGTRTINMVQLAEALAGELPGPPVQSLYVYCSNPAAVCPDQNRVLQGLRREDLFLVVHDLFQTDTADYADIVLPATSQLEHFDIHTSYGHHWLQANVTCIAPYAESRCNTQVFRDLADKMGFESELFSTSDEDLARTALWEEAQQPPEIAGITVDRLIADGPYRLRIPDRYTPFATGNFPTASGKCELYSEKLAELGWDPLPTWIPPLEAATAHKTEFANYPLELLSPPAPQFLNSTFVNVEQLRRSVGEPRLEIHPADAAERDIEDGQAVRVFNGRGAFFARAKVGETVRPGVIVAPSIWWNRYSAGNRNVNATTSSALTDLGGGATFFDNRVDVVSVPEEWLTRIGDEIEADELRIAPDEQPIPEGVSG